MRFFSLPLLLIFAFPAFASEAVLKFTLTKADGTPVIYEFLIPNDDTNQGVTLSRDEAVQQQHNAGVAALTWAKQFYGAHEIYLRSVSSDRDLFLTTWLSSTATFPGLAKSSSPSSSRRGRSLNLSRCFRALRSKPSIFRRRKPTKSVENLAEILNPSNVRLLRQTAHNVASNKSQEFRLTV